MPNREQVSVPLPAELREYVQRVAERELIPQAAVIRRLVANAARGEQAATPGSARRVPPATRRAVRSRHLPGPRRGRDRRALRRSPD